MIGFLGCSNSSGGSDFPSDYIMLKFSDVSWMGFDPQDVEQWNDFFISEGGNTNFTAVELGFGVVKLAGNLDLPAARLRISNKNLVDCDLSKFIGLERLDLSSNQLSNGGTIIDGLSNLTHLKLDNNPLFELNTTALMEQHKIESISLNNCDLFALSVDTLDTIRYLSVNNNEALSFIDGLNTTGGSLLTLDITACAFEEIELSSLDSLENLLAGNNPFASNLILTSNTNLKYLYLTACNQSGVFDCSSNPLLKLIVLTGNAYSKIIGVDTLASIDNLTSFYLGDNLFSLLEIGFFFDYLVTASKYPSVIKIDGAGNAAIGGDPDVVDDYNTLSSNSVIMYVNM